MASKKASTPDVNKARLSALKKLGLLSDVSARGSLTDAQKKRIRTTFNKYHDIANAPAGTFHKQDVSGFFPGQIKEIERAGIRVVNGKAYIRTENYQSVKIKKEKYAGARVLVVERKTDSRKTEREIIGTPVQIAEWRERLVRDFEAGKMKEGQFVALKAYDNSPMARSNTISLDSLFAYEAQIKYHDNADKVRDNLRLVVISVKDLSDLKANEKNRKQKDAEKYQRKVKSKKTATKKLTGRVKRK